MSDRQSCHFAAVPVERPSKTKLELELVVLCLCWFVVLVVWCWWSCCCYWTKTVVVVAVGQADIVLQWMVGVEVAVVVAAVLVVRYLSDT